MRLALKATFITLLCVYAIYIYRAVEVIVHPVVSSFEIGSIEKVGDKVTIQGVMMKSRSCYVDSVSIYGMSRNFPPKPLEYIYSSSEQKIKNRAVGVQEWGPWTIQVPDNITRIVVFSGHDCWPFWKTETRLAEIPIPRVES